jgi:HPt (histidine-containing phosphotransfer) domain-containing protein
LSRRHCLTVGDSSVCIRSFRSFPFLEETAIEGAHKTEVLDSASLDRLRKLGGDDLIARMIDLFLGYAEPKVALARESLAAGQLEEAGRAAHSLKSSAANLGAHELQDLAGRMELAAMNNDAASADALLPNLEIAFLKAKSQLEKRRKELGEAK